MNKKYLIILLPLCLILFSCKNKKDEQINFDNSQPLALAPDVQWAVIVDPYVSFKKSPDWNEESNGYCRKAEILQVKGKTQDNKNTFWYYFDEGWLPATSVAIYSNRYKALSAVEGMDK